MQRSTFLISAALIASAAQAQAQTLLEKIRTPDKAVPVVNQTLEGVWLTELRRPGQPAEQPTLPNLVTYHPNGTVVGHSADAAQTSAHGVWVRVGDRKFLQTMFVFNFNENRVLTTITKVRVNVQLSPDGQSLRGTQEVVVMNRDGNVMATIPGGTHTGVRLTPEIPGDFYEFQKQP
ncbi:MAG TPA: hypothetical protein VFB63_10980 [Bryobacteraceae bacterium]|jgi:hypothetical protein|nr:hypothetical protein [Bryobacteraceae bacterium]